MLLFSRNLHVKVVPDVGMKLGLVDDVLENNVMSGGTVTCSDSELYPFQLLVPATHKKSLYRILEFRCSSLFLSYCG